MKKAFTLAEVLIALVIIGVIAAITIPIIVADSQKQEKISSLQWGWNDAFDLEWDGRTPVLSFAIRNKKHRRVDYWRWHCGDFMRP